MSIAKYKYPSRDSIQKNSSGITILEQILSDLSGFFVGTVLAVSKGITTEDQKVKGFNPAGI